jgi:hypothetical protein
MKILLGDFDIIIAMSFSSKMPTKETGMNTQEDIIKIIKYNMSYNTKLNSRQRPSYTQGRSHSKLKQSE